MPSPLLYNFMESNIFKTKHGVIVSCDVATIAELNALVSATCDVEGIVGYKVGFTLALRHGLPEVTRNIGNLTDLPVIYDHQKAGTDVPQSGDPFAEACRDGGVKGVILFPQAGPDSEVSFIKGLFKLNMTTFVGGEMTHLSYLEKGGGFLRDNSPFDIYKTAAHNGVRYFIVPGTKPDKTEMYGDYISKIVEEPIFCFPGIGRQGGDMKETVMALGNNPAYAIIGTSIYNSRDMQGEAKKFCETMMTLE